MAIEIKKIKDVATTPAPKTGNFKVETATMTKPQAAPKPQTSKAKPQTKKEIKEVTARARFIRVAPRKARLIISQLQGLAVEQALNQLKFMHKGAVRPVTKLLNSAIANAENNFNLERKDLFIKKFVADGGPTLKRYQPRAHGRSVTIRKRTSHLNLILGIKEGAKPVIKRLTQTSAETVKVVNPDEIKKSGPKSGSQARTGEQGKYSRGFIKGFFQRKTG